jgi:uncharacterized protein (DUF1684 family)
MTAGSGDELELADWRRTVAELYADVRAFAEEDPEIAWRHWCNVRERLYRTHPQSPVPVGDRPTFRARHWPYDASLRFEPTVEPEPPSAVDAPPAPPLDLPDSGADRLAFRRIGRVVIPFASGARTLSLFWMEGYAGGLFLPFRDATNGIETYGAGRYVLDAVKGADLGGDPAASRLVVDFNFAYQPSCAFDPRWACPLAPPENRLDLAIPAGERLT